MEDRHELVKIRLEKVERLRELGVNPYPYSFEATVSAKAAVEGYEDGEHPEQGGRVGLAGRVVSLRSKGKVTFAHLDDGEGKIQVYLRRDALGEQSYEVVKLLDIGDFIGTSGYLFRTHAGEVTVYVEQLTLLAKSIRQLPIVKEKVVDDHKVVYDKVEDKELRYRQRYVDLIVNPEVKEIFRMRAQVISTMRGFLDRRGFLEVETPVLQPVYGGATARPFTTDHNALNTRLFLRISNELYLKRLIIGGFNKVYEFSRDFRNEGLDRKHNPEFTMLEFYQAYADYYQMMDLVENLVGETVRLVLKTSDNRLEWAGRKIDLSPPWPRRPMLELLGDALGERLVPGQLARERLAALCDRHGIETAPSMGPGKLIDELFSELVEPGLIDPTFVTDYPVETSPLAKRHRETPELTERFELIAGGMELVNAFSELNDPLDQRSRFEAQMKLRDAGDDEAQVLDEDFLRAMEYGMPPTGGVGIGIDRLVMLLTDSGSIKDVIFFPQMRPE